MRCIHDWLRDNGWGLRLHVDGEIVVTHKDGSGVVLRSYGDDTPISETLLYRMMKDMLDDPYIPKKELLKESKQ